MCLLRGRRREQARPTRGLVLPDDSSGDQGFGNSGATSAKEHRHFVTFNNAPGTFHAPAWRTPGRSPENLTADDIPRAVRSSLGLSAVTMLDVRQIPSPGYRGTRS